MGTIVTKSAAVDNAVTRKSAPAKVLTAGLRRDFRSYDKLLRARPETPLYQYPAMMVSPMQGALLDAVLNRRGGASVVCDPFLGSATTMVEALARGLAFVGRDINPLAILIARVETCDAADHDLQGMAQAVVSRARDIEGKVQRPAEAWCEKWFRPDVATHLAALQQAIREQPSVEVRRFLWATLAEVARTSGNHLASRPKLQTRPVDSLGRRLDVTLAFGRHAASTAARLERQAEQIHPASATRPSVDLACGDIRTVQLPRGSVDVVLSSPPYGDNHTTMPYGQSCYLPLRWIDTDDIDSEIDLEVLQTSKGLDTASLGGSLRVQADLAEATIAASPSLRRLSSDLADAPRHAWNRTISFFCDLDVSLARIVEACVPDAHLVLTLGDKTTYGRHVPTTRVVEELLEARGVNVVDRIQRRIASKRLAPRNEFARTIAAETILISQRQ